MKHLLWIFLLIFCHSLFAQKITGVIRDANSNESIIGAVVSVKGTTTAATTDVDGKFELIVNTPAPVILVISYIGYEAQEITIDEPAKPVMVKMKTKETELKAVEVTGSRISEKQKEAPLTVESLDMIAIKECPQNSFYEALGSLKGVDLTSASLGFTIVNTRGFNSTSPVRSLQLIDGVDNQSPGLNFSLGNFLGCSELDVLKVDLIAGASSAYYGPNAFNGVISMTTRSPFVNPGLEASVKVGERNLFETSVRWAQAFRDKDGKDKFGYKLNLFYMKANDWEANNFSASSDSKDGVNNPGGYDAVNKYGDEDLTGANNATSLTQQAFYPGLKRWYRTGYSEKDIVDYNSENLKIGLAFHYKLTEKIEAIVASNFGTGTTVYQGDNRYSLKDILFFQNRIEVRQADKFFIRAYATNEDAGKSYDAVFTAILMQDSAKGDEQWSKDYRNYWIVQNDLFSRAHNLPGFPPAQFPYDTAQANLVLAEYSDTVQSWHDGARDQADNGLLSVDNQPFYQPGTARFDSLLKYVTSRKSFGEGGSGFYDKSALYHIQGEYKFTPAFMDIIVGGNFRMYRPVSDGTIFSDTSGKKITNNEFGIYSGLEKTVCDEKLKLNFTIRLDKNDNFDYLLSPALSAVYILKANHIFRISFSSAVRNPTLSDQYLYYNVGRAILLGNITGYDSLATIPSITTYLNSPNLDKSLIEYFNVNPVKPEKVKTIEAGYRATLFNNLFMDANYYFSFYKDFIGYKIGTKLVFQDAPFQNRIKSYKVYRIATNSEDVVVSQGGSIGFNYFFAKYYAFSANYTYSFLDRRGSSDPLIPAFNTPINKFNIGINARDIKFKSQNAFGFNVNYKWIQGFKFEGSPQFTGYVDTYGLVDVQINYKLSKEKTIFKLGASNVLNNEVYQVYGGPLVGRLAYFSVLVSVSK